MRPRRLPHCYRLLVQRHFGIGGDYLRQLSHGPGYGAVIVACTQRWNHIAADIADFAIRQDAFQPIARLDPVLVIVNGQQNQQSPVRTLAAHLPLVFKAVGKVRRVVAIQGLYGDDGHLGVGSGVVQLRTDAIQPRYRLRG